jgi:hypothetical protein
MSWDVIRSIGLIMFVCGSIVLFAVKLGQYFDPPPPDAWIRLIAESWVRSGGDGLMVAGACLALLGIAVGYLTVTTDPQMAGVLGATEQGVKEKLIPTITVQGAWSCRQDMRMGGSGRMGVTEYWRSGIPSLDFDIGCPDDLAPLLGFGGDEFPKIGGRARKHRRT